MKTVFLAAARVDFDEAIDRDTLFVLAVAHQRRRPGYWAKRR